jgi:Tol biopolymer transport system component
LAPEESVVKSDGTQNVVNDWSGDGRSLLYAHYDPRTLDDLYLIHVSGNVKLEPIARSAFNDQLGRFSPHGKWIAYASRESVRSEVYVTEFPTARNRTQISTTVEADRGGEATAKNCSTTTARQ